MMAFVERCGRLMRCNTGEAFAVLARLAWVFEWALRAGAAAAWCAIVLPSKMDTIDALEVLAVLIAPIVPRLEPVAATLGVLGVVELIIHGGLPAGETTLHLP